MKKSPKTPYSQLHELSKVAALYGSTLQLLEWDQETYMPSGAIGPRSLQRELLSDYVHKLKTSTRFAKALQKLIDIETGSIIDETLSPAQIGALRAWRRDYLQAVKLPSSFVKTFAKTTADSIHAWAEARKKEDFKSFAPHLTKIVALCRKKADLLGYQEHPYDALLDLYEPDLKTSFLTPLFAKLKISLTALLKEITAQPPVNDQFLHGDFSEQKQFHFSKLILKSMGFEEETSRLDHSAHPFCMNLHPLDTRLTTRVHSDYLPACILAVIHEGGHGLYNRGLPAEHFGSPLCEAISLGIDESQSRFWETLIGHSLPFWEHFYPLLQKEFPQLASVYLTDFHHAINTVKPSLIRIHADEVTYSLHVSLRFELEKALIEGSLKVKEIPEAWNSKMRDYLGIVPQGYADGCLQDIHWSMGALGYFPTYTLGNLYASQFFAAFAKAHSDWKEKVSQGHLGFIREWLKENIHRYGREFTSEELCKRVTGKTLSEEPFLQYLNSKYKSLYHF